MKINFKLIFDKLIKIKIYFILNEIIMIFVFVELILFD